jgi:(p)ppGpp synthase/HD superfamily hydrolase
MITEDKKNMLDNAINIASRALTGHRDNDGNPLILRALKLMNMFDSYDKKIVAVLYYVYHTTVLPLQTLYQLEFNDEIIEALIILTLNENITPQEHQKRILSNKLSASIKRADNYITEISKVNI